MWEPDTLRAGPAGPGRSEDGMSGKKKSGSAKAAPRAYGRLTRHERDTVQRMLERGASCQAADEVHHCERGARQAQGLGEQGPRESHARRRVGESCLDWLH